MIAEISVVIPDIVAVVSGLSAVLIQDLVPSSALGIWWGILLLENLLILRQAVFLP